MAELKCIILLSEKSSGSSACQDLLVRFAGAKTVTKTRHFQNETLYWTKAASILGLPQRSILDSEVPIEPGKARQDLVTLLNENVSTHVTPDDDKVLIFDGWASLCQAFGPVFLEKSPHHLCQWSALELILDSMERNPEIDVLLLGLIRNPMDVIYSQFRRWGIRPEQLAEQWLAAYGNLLKLRDVAAKHVVIVRYEDIVTSIDPLRPVLSFCDVDPAAVDDDYLHGMSLSRWKKDKCFSFVLSEAVAAVAGEYGYAPEDLANQGSPFWPLYREYACRWYRMCKTLDRLVLRMLGKARGDTRP